MKTPNNERFIKNLQNAVRRERFSQRLYETLLQAKVLRAFGVDASSWDKATIA